MNLPMIPNSDNTIWNSKEYDLGLILSGQSKNFDLVFLNVCLIRNLLVAASTAGLFQITVYSHQVRGVQDIIWSADSSETSMVERASEILYNDFDLQNKLYITVSNNSTADTYYRLVVKYG